MRYNYDKKIIASTLLSASLVASSVAVPASASMDAFFFSPNGNSYRLNLNINPTDQLFSFLRSQENHVPTVSLAPVLNSLPSDAQQLAQNFRTLVHHPLGNLVSFFDSNFAFRFTDENGHMHCFVLYDQPQLLGIARRIQTLLDLSISITNYLISLVNYEDEVTPERTTSFLRLCDQIRDESDRINETLQGLHAPKPTSDDIVSGRCIDTQLMVIN